MNEEMKSKIYSRFDREGYFKGITWNEIDAHFNLLSKDKLFCHYCGKELLAKDTPPYRNVISLDRIIPICDGGKNSFDNIAICCAECNIIKGTMNAETFSKLLECLTSCGIKQEVFNQIYRGRLANKLTRLNKAKKEVSRRDLFEFA